MKSLDINIVVPCYNRIIELDLLLSSLEESISLSKECKISRIIITDDSDDNSVRNLVRNKYNYVKWYKGPKKGPAANRNAGVRKTTTTCEWIIFIDDDCYVNNEFISSYVSMMINGKTNVIEGKIICPDKKNSIFVRQPENYNGGVLASGNFAIRKYLFNDLGGFDEEFQIMEDIEFAARLRLHGKSFNFCENAIAFHPRQPKKISFYLKWIFHFKWQILIDYKCKRKELNQFFLKSALYTTINHILFLTRITYHLFSKFDKDRWIMYTFERLLAWVTLPLSIPHLIYWDFMYRKRLRHT